MRTRNGMDWTYRTLEAAAALSRLPDVYLDGELCVLGPDGQPDFGALQKALRTDGSAADVVYFAFDVLFAGDEDLRDRPLCDRKEILRELIWKHGRKVGSVLRYVEHFRLGRSVDRRGRVPVAPRGDRLQTG